MHLRLSLKQRRRLALALRVTKKVYLFILIVFVSLFLVSCNKDNNNISNTPPDEAKQIEIVYDILKEQYYSSLNLDISQITSLEELLNYTDIYTKIYKTGSTNIEKNESYIGLGITVIEHADGLFVSDVNDEIDIYKQLFVGDVIIKINNNTLKNLIFEDKTKALQKELNETITFTIMRLNKKINVEVKVVEVPFKSISYANYNDIGYIKINRFGTTTYNHFNNSLNQLESENIKGLIIDVRDNGGGYLTAVSNILKLFVSGSEPMFYLYEPKANEYNPIFPNEQTIEKPYPITVLVNQNSASVSEVLAGVMQKYGYNVIGEKTFGKDLYQTSKNLPSPFKNNEAISITSGYWLLEKNKSVKGGIYPDVFIYDSGIRSLIYPVLNKEYQLNEASPYIGVYQYILSLLIEGDYIPDYLNEDFSNMLKEYQSSINIEKTGILDEQTQKQLIITYRELKKDKNYDELLNKAITHMEIKINGN